MDRTTIKKRWNLRPGGDVVLWIIAVVLAVASLLVVYSSTGTSVVATNGSHFGVFIHQLGIVVMGLVVIYLVHKVNYQFYGRVVWAAYAIALVFAVLVYFIGEESGDAVRRMRIPLINFTFQPSDFLKVATVMVVARELARRQKTISTEPVTPPFTPRGWRKKNGRKILLDTTMPLLLPIVLSCGVIFPTNPVLLLGLSVSEFSYPKWLKKTRPAVVKDINQIVKITQGNDPDKEAKIKKIYDAFENEQIEYFI